MTTPTFTPNEEGEIGKDGLTRRQRGLVFFILTTHEQESRAPTVREMMAHLGAASSSPVLDLLKVLKKKGVLENAKTRQAHGVNLRGVRTGLIFDTATPEGQRLYSIYCAGHGK